MSSQAILSDQDLLKNREIGKSVNSKLGKKLVTGQGQFIDDLHEQKEQAVKQGWQRTYVRGQNMQGITMKDHQTKLNLRDFIPAKN